MHENNHFLKKEDQLFTEANLRRDGPWGYARRPHSSSDMWDLYSMGYKKAADDSIENAGRYKDFIIYPVVFLYRQYIELRLKQIITQGNSILEYSIVKQDYVYTKKFEVNNRTKTIYQIHDLDILWNELKDTFLKLFPDDSEDELGAPEECIRQFSAIDRLSYEYRYPIDTRGNLVQPSWDTISLKNLQDVMGKLSLVLDGTSEVVLDMPGHGYFLPKQRRLNEEQSGKLLDSFKSSGKEWKPGEIRDLIEKEFGLKYSEEQALKWATENGMYNL